MADDLRMGRPAQPGVQTGEPREYRGNRGGSKLPWVVLGIIVVVLVVLGALFRDKLFGGEDSMGRSSGYQAVFLTNGQVYFGKLSGASGQYATLKDIYYLQVVTEPGLQGSQQGQQAQQQQSLSLVKLGQELHGPVDSMQLNRDQILFYEDMKEDGKVMQAIREYQKNPPASSNEQAPVQQQQQQQAPAQQQQAPVQQAPAVNTNTAR